MEFSIQIEMVYNERDIYHSMDFGNASLYFAIFSQTINAIDKLLTAFNVQPKIGMNQSLI